MLAPLNVLPQGAIDFGLISPPARRRSRLPAAPSVARAISALRRLRQTRRSRPDLHPCLGGVMKLLTKTQRDVKSYRHKRPRAC